MFEDSVITTEFTKICAEKVDLRNQIRYHYIYEVVLCRYIMQEQNHEHLAVSPAHGNPFILQLLAKTNIILERLLCAR